MTDLAGVVEFFANEVELTVHRPGPPTIVNNRRANGALVAVTGIRGSVWPVTGESEIQLDDGKRITADVDVYALQALNIADDRTNTPGDRVTHDGNTYEIVARHVWSRGNFYAYAARQVTGS
jgi:hypothetical protein